MAKRKDELKREVVEHLDFTEEGKHVIKKYREVEQYWERKAKKENWINGQGKRFCTFPIFIPTSPSSNFSLTSKIMA